MKKLKLLLLIALTLIMTFTVGCSDRRADGGDKSTAKPIDSTTTDPEYVPNEEITSDPYKYIQGVFNKLTMNAEKHDENDPISYLEAEPDEYKELIYHGDHTLAFICNRFFEGIKSETNAELMKLLMMEITGFEDMGDNTDTPEKYFEYWKEHSIKLCQSFEGDIRKEHPHSYLIWLLSKLRDYDDSIELLYLSDNVDFSFIDIEESNGSESYGRVSYRIDDSHYLYMTHSNNGSGYSLDFHLVDIMNGTLNDSKSAECDILPHIESYTDEGIILSGWRDLDSGEGYIEAVYNLSFEREKIQIEAVQNSESILDRKNKIVSPDGKTIAYLVTVDELLQGYVEVVDVESGKRECILENVFSDKYPYMGTSGQGADRVDILRHTPIGFISNDVFAYHIGGVNWSDGYGIYNVKTGEGTEYLDGMRLKYICGDKMYISNLGSNEIYETDISGERRLLASENVAEGALVSFFGDAFRVDHSERSSSPYTSVYYSLDFSEKLLAIRYDVSFLNSNYPVYFFDNRLTLVRFQ